MSEARLENTGAVHRWFTQRVISLQLGALIGLTLASSGLVLMFMGPQKLWMPLFLVAAYSIVVLLPIPYAICAYFAYLSVDGAIKILSNYNPVMHIAQDALLLSLLMRSVLNPASGGVNKFIETPFIKPILMFMIWMLVQYLNPFSLGLMPSLAGTKIYLSMFFLFLLIYHHLEKRQVDLLFIVVITAVTLMAVFTCWEYLYGRNWLLALHPRYKAILNERFEGLLYRPFGTTNLPGGPSIWIQLTAPLATYMLTKPGSPKRVKLLSLAFFIVAVPTLVFCQVRTPMLACLASILLIVFCPRKDVLRRIAKFLVVLGIGYLALGSVARQFFDKGPVVVNSGAAKTTISADQLDTLRDRLNTLADSKTYQTARGGALDAMLALGEVMPFGIGLSRVGAASNLWMRRISEDRYFGLQWTFADNLYRYIFTELGIFGLATWLFMVGSIILFILAKSVSSGPETDTLLLWTCSTSCLLLLVGGFANEGILYAPVSAFFWGFMGIGLKEVSHGRK